MSYETEKKPLTIGQLARAADVGVETIRFYERQGLLIEPPRRPAIHHRGYRQYPQEIVARLRAIRRAKKLGFSLREIRQLLAWSQDTEPGISEIVGQAQEKLREIDVRIRDLHRMKEALEKLVQSCSEGTGGEFPLIAALGRDENDDW